MIHDALRRIAIQSWWPVILLPVFLPLVCFADASASDPLVRHRQPDRKTYQPPVLAAGEIPVSSTEVIDASRPSVSTVGLVDATLEQALPAPIVVSENDSESAPIQKVTFEQTVGGAPPIGAAGHAASDPSMPPGEFVQPCSCESCNAGLTNHAVGRHSAVTGGPVFDLGCDAAACCDSASCDGCDGLGCDGSSWYSLSGNDWFGSVELLLMFQSGDGLPPLATDGPLDPTGNNPPQVFAGQETVFKDITAGGRLTLGTWLDCYKDRHLVARGWFAGEQDYSFSGDQNSHPTLVRPFFNVTDGVTPAQDTLVVATPEQANGQLTIQGDSSVYGFDLSIRQLWYKRYGGTVDLLYGYQYMGLDQNLTISDRSTSLADIPPIGSVRATTDQFDVDNDFNGGQLGVATHYREGCWSFSSLAKIGFGSIRRRAVLSGSTLNSIDGNNATIPEGLLVRSTNAGTRENSTFGWVPELDLTLGWQRYPCFDVTFGYHLIVMTDALQVSGAIDPDLAVNSATNPTGAQRPTPNFRYGTYYVQGMHFGLSYIY